MISKQRAADIRTRNDALMAWVDSIRGKNGWASYLSLEVFDFVTNPPDKYFLYINEANHTATTWTGETLGQVSFGREYRDNFGGKRVPVTVYGINGLMYHGTYFCSAGNYARVRASKIKPPARLDGKIQRLHSCSDSEIKAQWEGFSLVVRAYFEHYMPEQFKKIQEAIERCNAKEQE